MVGPASTTLTIVSVELFQLGAGPALSMGLELGDLRESVRMILTCTTVVLRNAKAAPRQTCLSQLHSASPAALVVITRVSLELTYALGRRRWHLLVVTVVVLS